MVRIVYSSEVIPVARYWERMEMVVVNVCRTKFKQTFHTALFCRWICLGYLTVAIVGPAEPAHDGRAHPGERPGQGPEKRPIGERLCHGEVGEARWEDPTVPGKLDGDIHDEIPKTM